MVKETHTDGGQVLNAYTLFGERKIVTQTRGFNQVAAAASGALDTGEVNRMRAGGPAQAVNPVPYPVGALPGDPEFIEWQTRLNSHVNTIISAFAAPIQESPIALAAANTYTYGPLTQADKESRVSFDSGGLGFGHPPMEGNNAWWETGRFGFLDEDPSNITRDTGSFSDTVAAWKNNPFEGPMRDNYAFDTSNVAPDYLGRLEAGDRQNLSVTAGDSLVKLPSSPSWDPNLRTVFIVGQKMTMEQKLAYDLRVSTSNIEAQQSYPEALRNVAQAYQQNKITAGDALSMAWNSTKFHYQGSQRTQGVVQAVNGGLQVWGATLMAGTGLGAVVGVPVGLHGVDNMGTGCGELGLASHRTPSRTMASKS
ncbi:hypothetical protein [Pseudoduganella namucuonensis]|uniref:Uncharacterized protein n=1 Tax=Pseudoduganella namucuonensis TaxID=1035707 RepID=A0A1I7M4U9_9BURK|nr:hypothetical protein [Pseudoduganella namucuonensis]SFV16971.1 hypothetical protein SAMN05216552_105716 [Pseudoduganella namucuonensis]